MPVIDATMHPDEAITYAHPVCRVTDAGIAFTAVDPADDSADTVSIAVYPAQQGPRNLTITITGGETTDRYRFAETDQQRRECSPHDDIETIPTAAIWALHRFGYDIPVFSLDASGFFAQHCHRARDAVATATATLPDIPPVSITRTTVDAGLRILEAIFATQHRLTVKRDADAALATRQSLLGDFIQEDLPPQGETGVDLTGETFQQAADAFIARVQEKYGVDIGTEPTPTVRVESEWTTHGGKDQLQLTLFTAFGAERYDFDRDGADLTYRRVGNELYPPIPLVEAAQRQADGRVRNLVVPTTAESAMEQLQVIHDLVETIGETADAFEDHPIYEKVLLPLVSADLYNLQALVVMESITGPDRFVEAFQSAAMHPQLADRDIEQKDLGLVLDEMYGDLPPEDRDRVMDGWENDLRQVPTGIDM